MVEWRFHKAGVEFLSEVGGDERRGMGSLAYSAAQHASLLPDFAEGQRHDRTLRSPCIIGVTFRIN